MVSDATTGTAFRNSTGLTRKDDVMSSVAAEQVEESPDNGSFKRSVPVKAPNEAGTKRLMDLG